MARTTGSAEPRQQITLQVPQTVYKAVERITRTGERHGFLLDIIEQDPRIAAEVAKIEVEEATRAKYEELGRRAVEQGVATLE